MPAGRAGARPFSRPRARLLATLLALPGLAACGDEPAAPRRFVPGTSYFGAGGHVEYIAGDLPLIFSAPHGGTLRPLDIPPRAVGPACGSDVVTVGDANTAELAREIGSAFLARTGRRPHIVLNLLHRDRMDANRDVGEAACGSPAAEAAWRDYHAFIDAARAAVGAGGGRGWYTDLHGHGHAAQRLELGYGLGAATLRRADAELDATPALESAASVATFSRASPLSFSALLRGPTALGTLFADAGYPAVPSRQDPAPASGEGYFSGGYSTARHACASGGAICGVQIEANFTGVRDAAPSRARFAAAVAAVYGEYLAQVGIALPAAGLLAGQAHRK